MSPARPSTCTLRVSRHTCSMVRVHASSHGAASRTITGKNTNTHAALLPSCMVALLRKRFVVTTRAQLRWKAALTIPRGACAFVDAMCCDQAFTSCTTRCHSPPMPAACTVPWSGDAVCSYSTPLAHPRRHTCFVSLANGELRVCKGLCVMCLGMARVVHHHPPLR